MGFRIHGGSVKYMKKLMGKLSFPLLVAFCACVCGCFNPGQGEYLTIYKNVCYLPQTNQWQLEPHHIYYPMTL